MPITVATPVVSGDYLFVTSVYDGALMLKLHRDAPTVEQLWRRKGRSERVTDALQCVISTPYMAGMHLYGIDSWGPLRCLDVRNGERLWEDKTAAPQNHFSTVHFVRHGDDTWLFNELGQLIIARPTPQGYREISRAKLITPTLPQSPGNKPVCWAHPAFAGKRVYARSDEELLCVDLAAAR
jgi:hypothetical protein